MHAILPGPAEKVIKSAAVEQQQKRTLQTNTISIHKGHRIWELCIKTLEFEEIVLKKNTAKFSGHVTTSIKMKDGHLYCAALNPRNAEKEFNNMLLKLLGK